MTIPQDDGPPPGPDGAWRQKSGARMAGRNAGRNTGKDAGRDSGSDAGNDTGSHTGSPTKSTAGRKPGPTREVEARPTVPPAANYNDRIDDQDERSSSTTGHRNVVGLVERDAVTDRGSCAPHVGYISQGTG